MRQATKSNALSFASNAIALVGFFIGYNARLNERRCFARSEALCGVFRGGIGLERRASLRSFYSVEKKCWTAAIPRNANTSAPARISRKKLSLLGKSLKPLKAPLYVLQRHLKVIWIEEFFDSILRNDICIFFVRRTFTNLLTFYTYIYSSIISNIWYLKQTTLISFERNSRFIKHSESLSFSRARFFREL